MHARPEIMSESKSNFNYFPQLNHRNRRAEFQAWNREKDTAAMGWHNKSFRSLIGYNLSYNTDAIRFHAERQALKAFK